MTGEGIPKAFGRLTVIGRDPASAKSNPRFDCRCECGATIKVYAWQIKLGRPAACMKCRKNKPLKP